MVVAELGGDAEMSGDEGGADLGGGAFAVAAAAAIGAWLRHRSKHRELDDPDQELQEAEKDLTRLLAKDHVFLDPQLTERYEKAELRYRRALEAERSRQAQQSGGVVEEGCVFCDAGRHDVCQMLGRLNLCDCKEAGHNERKAARARGKKDEPRRSPDGTGETAGQRRANAEMRAASPLNAEQWRTTVKNFELEHLRAQGATDDQLLDREALLDLKLAPIGSPAYNAALARVTAMPAFAAQAQGRPQRAPASTSCRGCRGVGYYYCPRCRGVGQEQTRNFYGQVTNIPCGGCSGSGKQPCRMCNGTGRMASGS